MENEGIMSLPAGADMQGDQALRVSSADSYDAALTALGQVDPQALAAARESLRQNLSEMNISSAELEMIIEMFEYVSQRPDQYPALVKQLEKQGIVDPGEMPEEYDPVFLGTMLSLLNEMKVMRAEGAQAPMQMGPGAVPPPMAMAEGGLADVAEYLASKGRNGDSMLAHITPEEAQMLKRMGGSGTINPETGLPEFFLGKIVSAISGAVKSVVSAAKQVLASPVGKIIGTIALAAVLGPTAIGATLGTAGTAALSSGAITLASGGSLKDALVSGAMGYIGGGGDFGGLGSPLKGLSGMLPGAGSAINTGLTTGLIGAGAGLAMGMKPSEALRMGLTSGAISGGLAGLQGAGIGRTDQAVQEAGPPSPGTAAEQVRTTLERPGIGAPGPIGTARDMLGTGITGPGGFGTGFQAPVGNVPYSPGVSPSGVDYGLVPPSGAPASAAAGQGLLPGTTGAASSAFDFSRAVGGQGAGTNYGLTSSAAPAAPASTFDRALAGAKNFYNEYLSPDRPGLPKDVSLLRKYAPLAAAGTAVAAASGAMRSSPGTTSPLYNDQDYYAESLRKARERTKFLEEGGYGLGRGGISAPSPLPVAPPSVQLPAYSEIPVSAIPRVIPMGITQSPGGIMQPYNISGQYGVPLLYGNVPGRAEGGEMTMRDFPRKTGPINGPGTGTSDSIPAMLSDGEFVFTAKAVRNAGNGSRRKGAARMYKLMKMLEGGAVKGK